MQERSVREISLKGFAIVLIAIILIAISSFYFLNKISQFNAKHHFYETSYNNIFEFKYYTEKLLTTTKLQNTRKLWINSKQNFSNNIEKMKKDNSIEKSSEIFTFWHIVYKESIKINEILDDKLFKEKNLMEKSILRRLGEELNSDKHNDYYNSIFDLKNKIDYLGQYEQFLLEEVAELKETQEKNLNDNIFQTKITALLSIFLILITSSIFIYLILRKIKEIETKVLITQDKLKDSLDEINYIINTAIESIIIEKNHKIIDINESAQKIFKFSKQELLGSNIEKLICKDSISLIDDFSNKNESFEIDCNTKENHIFPTLMKIYNFTNKEKEQHKIYAIIDLSEIKQKDVLIFQQSKLAAMGEMLENIAHQWRQPLSAITSTASGALIQKEYGILKEEDLDKYLENIIDSTKHLSATIDDFRSFYVENDNKSMFSLIDTIKKAEKLLSSKFESISIKLLYDEIKDIEIYGYKNEFIQVLMNLFGNAKDELENKESLKRVIIINLETTDENYILSIKDNAGGIPNNIMDKIFNEHFTTKEDGHGTGIGLYMSKKIIEKIDASINVQNSTFIYDNEEFIGANFIIAIPKIAI